MQRRSGKGRHLVWMVLGIVPAAIRSTVSSLPIHARISIPLRPRCLESRSPGRRADGVRRILPGNRNKGMSKSELIKRLAIAHLRHIALIVDTVFEQIARPWRAGRGSSCVACLCYLVPASLDAASGFVVGRRAIGVPGCSRPTVALDGAGTLAHLSRRLRAASRSRLSSAASAATASALSSPFSLMRPRNRCAQPGHSRRTSSSSASRAA